MLADARGGALAVVLIFLLNLIELVANAR